MTTAADRTDDEQTGARLQRGVSFIERNIAHPIVLAEVAAEAALSEHHFHRLFRARYGIPVMDYVRRRRLAQAADELIRTPAPIIELALAAGFESQAAFTRAFRRVFHATPAAYRAKGRHVPWMTASVLDEETLRLLPELSKSPPRLEAIEPFQVSGIDRTLIAEQRSTIPELWSELAGRVDADTWAGVHYGLSDGSRDVLGGLLRYTAAVPSGTQPITRLIEREVPGGVYAVFPLKAVISQLSAAIDYLFGAWLPNSGFTRREAPSFEHYPPDFVPGEQSQLEFWIPVEPR